MSDPQITRAVNSVYGQITTDGHDTITFSLHHKGAEPLDTPAAQADRMFKNHGLAGRHHDTLHALAQHVLAEGGSVGVETSVAKGGKKPKVTGSFSLTADQLAQPLAKVLWGDKKPDRDTSHCLTLNLPNRSL